MQDVAKQLARGGGAEANTTTPITVERALTDYRADLISRDADPYNAEHPRAHLTAVLRQQAGRAAHVERTEGMARRPDRQDQACDRSTGFAADVRGA